MKDYNIPDNRLYDAKQHLWIEVTDGVAAVGITDFAQDQMGEVLFVELWDEGEAFEQGALFTVVESGKKAADLYLPFAGEAIAYNQSLEDSPELLNDYPYEAWIARFTVSDDTGLADLTDAAGYLAAIAGK